MNLRDHVSSLDHDMRAWRHDFHAHPELGFEVQRTAGVVAKALKALGCDDVVSGIGRTGVVGIVHGRRSTSGRVIGIRADMDGLPIEEQTGLAHASRLKGQMHACGHDGHMAIALGAATYLARTRSFNGAAAFIFQPAEELGGGANVMVRDGLMERFDIDEVYALHNMPGLPCGTIAARHGTLFAASDNFEILLTGHGGHAAYPHQTRDPIACAAQLISSLQQVVSRNIDPLCPCVVSVTSIQCGNSFNIIPEQGRLLGTVRTLDESTRADAEKRVRDTVRFTARSFGIEATLDYRREYPATVNHREQTEFAMAMARATVGDTQLYGDTPPIMGCEDFAYMLQSRPGAYVLLGNGDTEPVHHPRYDFNDDSLTTGASYFSTLVEKAMPI